MGTGPKRWTEELITRRFRDGRGRGDKAAYTPWLYVQEFSSSGTQTRIPSLVVDRTVHTFSYIEKALYLVHEFEPGLVDYREQFPMDRRVTLGAAQALGIRHPLYPITRVPVVMSIDAVVTRRRIDGSLEVSAWDAKPDAELENRRVLEKLSLHRAYCAHFRMPHHIFTEQSVTKTRVRNIEWLRGAVPKPGEVETVPGLFDVHRASMLRALATTTFNITVRRFCDGFDRTYGFPAGMALRLFKVLAWERVITLNLDLEEAELQPVPSLPDPAVAKVQLQRMAA